MKDSTWLKGEADFLEVFETLPATGWLSEAEGRLLWDSAKETDGPILEVGCYYGRSTCLLAALGRPMYCVDPFEGFDSDDPTGVRAYEAFMRMLNERAICNVNVYKQKVEDWEPVRGVGLAYLDGDHTFNGTLAQVKKALACGARVIGVHDVNDSGGGNEVRKACLLLLGPWRERVERLAVWDVRNEGEKR